MIEKLEAKTFITRLYCDNCGAEMMQSDTVLMTYPPQYSYYCPRCGETMTANKQYPYTSYEEVEDD